MHGSPTNATRLAIDIGSTVVKVARIDTDDELLDQEFHPRDFQAGIARQVESILEGVGSDVDRNGILACSSANGGLRVGIVCLTKRFSGVALRNQVLLAGANPVFLHELDEDVAEPDAVDVLLVGGGIDCEDAAPIERRLPAFRPERYRFGSVVYAGNRHFASRFAERCPGAVVIRNVFGEGLASTSAVFETLRRAYLDDLVYKEGISELADRISGAIRPTPEVVSCGFQRAVSNRSSLPVAGPSLLIDIGGATTDLHYTVEIVREDSPERPDAGSSVARYVFTDLGIAASRDRTVLQIRSHPRAYEFVGQVVANEDPRAVYSSLREGTYELSPNMLSYACLFLALDRFAHGRGPGLPTADLRKLSQVILTGGAVQAMDEAVATRVVQLSGGTPRILVDRRYQVWVDGITWSGKGPA
jgi:hypothetical protein